MVPSFWHAELVSEIRWRYAWVTTASLSLGFVPARARTAEPDRARQVPRKAARALPGDVWRAGMEKLAWVVSAGEPVIMIALLLGVGIPLLLLPGTPGVFLAGVAAAVVLAFNYYVDRSISRLPVRLGRDGVLGREAIVVE